MSVHLSPISARGFTVGVADDPYKKYWWAILAGFIATGAWLCSPLMETPVGSVRVDTTKPVLDAASVEKGLDSAENPNGAPGGAIDLSMGDAEHKSKGDGGDDMASMLYQAPPEAAAAAAASGKPLSDATAPSASSLAQQLKDLAAKKTDASGWTEKAQAGFTSPHLTGGGLSGEGSAKGSSTASASVGGGLFGTKVAQVSFGEARGLDAAAESPGFKALKAAAGASPSAAAARNLQGSLEAMHAGMSQTFDGAQGKPPAQIGMGAMAQANAALASAPANLKANNPQLDMKKLPDPPAAPTPASASQNMGQQLMMMVAMTAVGGIVGGLTSGLMSSMGMATVMTAQQSAANTASTQALATNLQTK